MIEASYGPPLVAATGTTGMVGQRAKELFPELGWESLAVDITDQAAVDTAIAATPATVIINLAAYTNVAGARQQSGDKDGSCYRINVHGAGNIARACASAGKHFVHVSTDYVFQGDRHGPYLETDDGDARTDWYGASPNATPRNSSSKLTSEGRSCACPFPTNGTPTANQILFAALLSNFAPARSPRCSTTRSSHRPSPTMQ